MKAIKRTFEASQHPAGSVASTQLNLSPVTSQYLPALKWVIVEDDGTPTRWLFRTKREAEEKIEALRVTRRTVLAWIHNKCEPKFPPWRVV